MVFTREEAARLSSFIKLINMEDNDLNKYSESALAEIGEDIIDTGGINECTRKYIEEMFSNYKNEYLASFLTKNLLHEFSVTGVEPSLFVCPCCSYKTLKRKAEYSICNVCFWEDDGTSDDKAFSSVNGLTLKEAKCNWFEFGACRDKFLEFLDEERFDQYESVGSNQFK